MMDSEVTDLPHPDSPTKPMVWPLPTEKVIPSTALTAPMSVKKCVFKPSTSKILFGSFIVVIYSSSGTFLRLFRFSYFLICCALSRAASLNF